uniref:Homeobox domain-containing protein n=1 Tax=Panagrolaimus sp. PS1159 TaxID=55785 RepID=A0AC35FN74_9BILA
MTSPTNTGGGTQQQSQNGTTPIAWDPSTISSSTSLNGSTPNIQQPPLNFYPNFYQSAANSSFGSTNSYNSADLSNYWNTQSAAAAAAFADPRFPKINGTNASPFNSSIPYLASLSASMAGNAIRNSRRRRNLFSQNQVNELKRAFETEPYVKPETREKLAARTGLTPQQVKIWFQNNRYKCKQKSKEDERINNRTSTSFNDSGSPGSPSSSGNELSMTATNSPDIKLNIGSSNGHSMIPMVDSQDAYMMKQMFPMVHSGQDSKKPPLPMIHPQEAPDVKPIYPHHEIAPQFNYPMPYPYGYNGFNLPYNNGPECFSQYFSAPK